MSLVIHYQRNRFEAPKTPMTGSELRALFLVPAGDLLYHEKGNKTEGDPIADDTSVPLKNGDHFVSIPNNITGGAASKVALAPRLQREIDRIEEELTGVEVARDNDNTVLIITSPSEGWTPDPLRVLMMVPPLYPDNKPDLILLEEGARWPGGATPRLMQTVRVAGESWQQISWHWSGDYDPAADNLFQFARSIRKYLRAPAA